eukprot:COSAG01_NODE_12850_length_1675_cov_8.966371_2_plen_101_part_00
MACAGALEVSNPHPAVLCVCEELVWAGSKKDSSVMKDLLTSDTIQINAKYAQPRTEKSFLNLVILTNSEWAIQAGMSARRYFVLNLRLYYRRIHIRCEWG